jgi:hypothetical protein
MSGASKSATVFALAALLVLVGAARAWRAGHTSAGIDFYQYWVVGKALGRGDVSSIYDHSTRAALGQEFLLLALTDGSPRQRAAAEFRKLIEPMSTPFLFAGLRPFSLGGYDAGYDAFRIVSLAGLVTGCLVFGQLAGMPVIERLVLAALLIFAFQAVTADLLVGNVGHLGLGMVAAYTWLLPRPADHAQIAGGVVLGLAIAFKPNVAGVAPFVVGWWALTGQWRRVLLQLGGMTAAGLIVWIVTLWFYGSLDAWMEWIRALRGMPPMPIEAGNVSLLLYVERWFGVSVGVLPLLLASAAAVWAAKTGGRNARSVTHPLHFDLAVVSAGCLVLLLSSPLVWLHYLVLAIPAVIVALRAAGPRRWAGFLAFVAISGTVWRDILGLWTELLHGLAIVCGLLTLYALMLLEIARSSQEKGKGTGEAAGEPGGPGASVNTCAGSDQGPT